MPHEYEKMKKLLEKLLNDKAKKEKELTPKPKITGDDMFEDMVKKAMKKIKKKNSPESRS